MGTTTSQKCRLRGFSSESEPCEAESDHIFGRPLPSGLRGRFPDTRRRPSNPKRPELTTQRVPTPPSDPDTTDKADPPVNRKSSADLRLHCEHLKPFGNNFPATRSCFVLSASAGFGASSPFPSPGGGAFCAFFAFLAFAPVTSQGAGGGHVISFNTGGWSALKAAGA